jgi:hypothetical protein
MWRVYRRWKPVVALALASVVLWLMRGEPDESVRWLFGMGIASALLLGYVVEEAVWIARNRGRPCPRCGRALRPQAFRVERRCSECGEVW